MSRSARSFGRITSPSASGDANLPSQPSADANSQPQPALSRSARYRMYKLESYKLIYLTLLLLLAFINAAACSLLFWSGCYVDRLVST